MSMFVLDKSLKWLDDLEHLIKQIGIPIGGDSTEQ